MKKIFASLTLAAFMLGGATAFAMAQDPAAKPMGLRNSRPHILTRRRGSSGKAPIGLRESSHNASR